MRGRGRYLALVPGAVAAPFVVVLGAAPARTQWVTGLWIVVYFAWWTSGAVTFLRRPDNAAARRLLLVGTAMMLWGVAGFGVAHQIHDSGTAGWAAVALVSATDLLVPASILALFTVYPDGRYGRAFERRLVHTAFALVVLAPLATLLTRPTVPEPTFLVWMESYIGEWPSVPSPLDVGALHPLGDVAGALAPIAFNIAIIAATVVFVLRYRRLAAPERVQLTWPIYMVLVGVAFGSASLLLDVAGLHVPLSNWVDAVSTVALPAFVAIGLLRPDLFDIQRVLRRSLLYGAVWIVIAAAYIGLTAAVGIAAASSHVEIAVLVTIVATLLFQPLRRLVQRRARNLVFGRRVSRDELLRRFGTTLEHTLEPSELTAAVAATVHDALIVAWVRIRVEGEVVAAYGIDPTDTRPPATSADLGHELGLIECGPRIQGRWDSADRELLAALGRQTGLALRNARLASELRERLDEIRVQAESLAASRSRIVEAQEAARRGIERDIHDGVQQELVALIARIALARNQLRRDPTLAHDTLGELQSEAAQALEDLRELARGIHPSVLSDRGIVDAIEGRAARLPLGVTLECDPGMRDRRFPQAVEGAVYFLVCEAFTNAVRHSGAERVLVRLHQDGDGLCVEVSDDGSGFDPGTASLSGLRGLEDRLDALGGTMTVVSSPGAGTAISARLAVDEHTAV